MEIKLKLTKEELEALLFVARFGAQQYHHYALLNRGHYDTDEEWARARDMHITASAGIETLQYFVTYPTE
jgi:hypothetical protein